MFRKGDKVVCIKREYGNETIGKIYVVDEDYNPNYFWLTIAKDDNGICNQYRPSQFKLLHRDINDVSEFGDLFNVEGV